MFGSIMNMSEALLLSNESELKMLCAPYLNALEAKLGQIRALTKIKEEIGSARFSVFSDNSCILLEVCPAVMAEIIVEQIEIRQKQMEQIYLDARENLETEAYEYFMKKEKELV
jgi:hypothetical protein